MMNGTHLSAETMDVIINHSGALVYIIDLVSYKILYANKLCQEEFGNIIDLPCDSVLQENQSFPCDYSSTTYQDTIFDYPEESTFEWSNQSITEPKHYMFKDRVVRLHNKHLVKIRIGINITQEKFLEIQLLQQKNYDQLTGLLNREKLLMDIETLSPTACAIFNIDSFREINDFFGINIGDRVLIQLAEEWNKMGLTVYRVGGDEFAVLFYGEITRDSLYEQLKHLHSKFQTLLINIEGESINLQMRVGAALAKEKLLTRSDIALHTAKEKKLCIAIYEEQENIENTYKKNIAMTTQIHKALSQKRIICHYQPVINCRTDQIFKYEALVRMVDEKGNLISPMEFLPVAKKTKLYKQITLEVIQQACQLFARRKEPFSVNLSIEDINDHDVVQKIIDTIISTDTAQQITFEILESEGIENYDSVAHFISQAQSLGSKIAIDDFGTGYSNFEHILKLNIDYIKIDGSLITGIAHNQRHKIIVETISNFAQKIGAKTIAEFVSSEETYRTLKLMGIDYAQGYYLGKPDKLPSIIKTSEEKS